MSMKKRISGKKLTLTRETIIQLDAAKLGRVVGGGGNSAIDQKNSGCWLCRDN